MKTLRLFTTAVIAGVLSLSVQAHNGVDHDGTYVEIDGLTATGGAGTVDVAGTVVFGGAEFVAFEDAAGDSVAPGQGFDITKGTITQVGTTLVFTMSLTDLPLGDVQPGALYNWNLGVSGAEAQRLFGWRVRPEKGTGWNFSVVTFATGFSQADTTGQFTGQDVVWEVDIAEIGAAPGAKIGPGDGPMTASQGGFGRLQLTELVDYDTASWAGGTFHVGGGVTLTLTGPGDFDEQIVERTTDGAFDARFTDVPAGTYTLTVTSKYADAVFERTFPVTVS